MRKNYRKKWKGGYLKNFLQIANWRKSEQYIKCKRLILSSDNPNFLTHTLFFEGCRYSWCDFTFISSLYKVAYRCMIKTCQQWVVEEVESEFHSKEGFELFKKYDLGCKFIKSDRKDEKGHSYYELDRTEDDKLRPELGNRSYWDYCSFKVDEMLAEKPLAYEFYKIEPQQGFHGYNFVDMVVNEEIITPEIICKHINNFYQLGEKDWKSDTPVNPDSIVYKHDWRNIKEICLGNAIKDFKCR